MVLKLYEEMRPSLSPTADLKVNTQTYYEIYSALFKMYAVDCFQCGA